MAAIAVGVLVVTAVATVGLARREAVSTAEEQLQQKAPEVAGQLETLGRRLRVRQARGGGGGAIRQLVATALRISNGGLVTITPDGQVADGFAGLGNGNLVRPDTVDLIQVPRGLAVDDLDTETLLAGREQTGRVGGIVFIARPLTPTRNGTPVLLLTQTIEDDPTRQARGFFLLAALGAVGLAILVAVYLARRLTRPLAAMGQTARSIATGDLAARVDIGRRDDELGELARTLNEMAEQLEQARGRERAFVLSVSHDLRTPLTSIKGYAEALVDGAIETDTDRTRAARVIDAEARRLERLVADLLDLARLDARQFSLSPRPVDAAETVRTAVDAFAPAAADLGIALTVDGPDGLPADVDPDRLAQIVANLLENGLNYAASAIVVELRAIGTDELELRVSDDGPGIPPDDLPHVFERLYVSRVAPGRSLGTGIGLAIVRELAVAMGGQVRVDAEVASGAGFVVRLPVLRVSDDREAPRPSPALP
jgi:two-component system sensor histidine kinase BaeS